MVAVGEDAVLLGQEGAAAIDEVEAGQPVLLGDLLGAQVFPHRLGEEGAALHRRIVGDDHAGRVVDHADAGDDAGGRHLAAVEAMGGERRELEEGAAGIEQQVDAVAHQDLAAGVVAIDLRLAAPGENGGVLGAEPGDQIGERLRARALEAGGGHGDPLLDPASLPT